MRLGEVGTSFTWRELKMMLRQLQPGSRFEVEEYGDLARWSREHYMLADVFDAIQALRHETARAAGKRATPPKPYPRPEVDRARFLEPRLQQWRNRHKEA